MDNELSPDLNKESTSETANPKTNSSQLHKVLITIIIGLVLMCGYLFWRTIQLQKDLSRANTRSDTNNITIPPSTPTQIPPSPTGIEQDVLKRIQLTYDANKFDLKRGSVYRASSTENIEVPALILADKTGKNTYLKIVDMSSFDENISDLNDVIRIIGGGAEHETSLRNVTIEANVYSFKRRSFGDGVPLDENCFQGGGVNGDYFYIKEQKLGIIVESSTEEKSCTGATPTIIATPDKPTQEEVLQVLESLKVE